MTTQEIKKATDNGVTVYWKQPNYIVTKDSKGNYFIKCTNNGHLQGLTTLAGDKLNGRESDFYTETPRENVSVFEAIGALSEVMPETGEEMDNLELVHKYLEQQAKKATP